MKPQLLIASPVSGSGKTTFTLGLLRVLQQRGLRTQTFKCGTDCIDTQYHSIAAGYDSVNLDEFMLKNFGWLTLATIPLYAVGTYLCFYNKGYLLCI